MKRVLALTAAAIAAPTTTPSAVEAATLTNPQVEPGTEQAQVRHSTHVLRFFSRTGRGHWIVARRRSSCLPLPARWQRSCTIGRSHVRAHRWLRTVAHNRIDAARIRREHTVPEWPWGALAGCESGRRWNYNGPSGFDGGLQFHPGTWNAYRLPGYPTVAYHATPAQQVRVAERVLAAQGWNAWPACSLKLGLR